VKKPAALRDYLIECIPWLKNNPDQLQIYIDSGTIATRLESSLNFRYNYTLQIIVTDFALHPDVIFVPILAWLRSYQIDFQSKSGEGLTFEAEIISDDLVDLSISITLDEAVIVSEHPFDTEHLAEPEMEYLLPDPPLLVTGFGNSENLTDSIPEEVI
jgi:hypothetical protein